MTHNSNTTDGYYKKWYITSVVLLNVILLTIAYGSYENSFNQYNLPEFVGAVWPFPGVVLPSNQFHDPALGYGVICFDPKQWDDSYFSDFDDLKLNGKSFYEYPPPNKVGVYYTDFESFVCWVVTLPPGRYSAEIQIKDKPIIYWRFRLIP